MQFLISDVERVRPDSNRDERAEELIQVKYLAACPEEPLLLVRMARIKRLWSGGWL